MKYAIVDLLWAKSHGIEHEEMLVPFEDESFSRI